MIIPDVNLLLYAYDSACADHAASSAWWQDALSSSEPVRLPWVTVLGFIRIGTHPRVFNRPMSIGEANGHIESWLEQPVVDFIQPGPRHWSILAGLLRATRSTANLTTDAHLAALGIEYGATVCSSDGDFGRFPGLKLFNPVQ